MGYCETLFQKCVWGVGSTLRFQPYFRRNVDRGIDRGGWAIRIFFFFHEPKTALREKSILKKGFLIFACHYFFLPSGLTVALLESEEGLLWSHPGCGWINSDCAIYTSPLSGRALANLSGRRGNQTSNKFPGPINVPLFLLLWGGGRYLGKDCWLFALFFFLSVLFCCYLWQILTL